MRTDNLKYVLLPVLTRSIQRHFWHNYCVLCIMELIERQHSSDRDRDVPCPPAASVPVRESDTHVSADCDGCLTED